VSQLRVGGGTMAASASRAGKKFTTTATAPAGWTLTLGHTLPAGATVASVTLDGRSVPWTFRDTTRGREVYATTTTGAQHTVVIKVS
jgi:hypothetical protein